MLQEKNTYVYEKKELERENEGLASVEKGSMLSGALSLTISVPFKGNGQLFKCKPSSYKPSPPEGIVEESEIHLQYVVTDRNSNSIRRKYTRSIEQIKEYLQWIRKDLDSHNSWIKNKATIYLSKRKQDLLRDQGFLKSLGLPIKRNDKIPETYTIPTIRKKLKISRPTVTKEVYKPEPTLPEAEYEYILETISHMSLSMERSPKTFFKLHEEEIRDFFLIILNSHYEGQVTGETFNFGGKTDILMRHEDKNAFIAECKIWRGEKSLSATIDQILGYTSWRDTKTAIFLFSKTQNFSQVLEKIDNVAKSNRFYKRQYELKNERLKNETTFSYIFHQPSDVNRELFLTILVFNIPSN